MVNVGKYTIHGSYGINLENRRCSEGTHCGEVLEEGSSEEIRYG